MAKNTTMKKMLSILAVSERGSAFRKYVRMRVHHKISLIFFIAIAKNAVLISGSRMG